MVLKFTVQLGGVVKLSCPYQLAGQSQLGQRADTLIGGARRFLQSLDRGRLVAELGLAQASMVAGDARRLLPGKSADYVVELLQRLLVLLLGSRERWIGLILATAEEVRGS